MKKFIQNNVKLVVIYSILSILLVISLFAGIRRCVIENQGNGTIRINGNEFIEMIDANQSFIFVIGQQSCTACKGFNNTLREYTKDGKEVYYMYIDNTQDLFMEEAMALIKNKISKELPLAKRPKVLFTPTTFYVEDGIIKDIYTGNVNYKDKDRYDVFKATMNGEYVRRKTIISEDELISKINNNDSFSLVIGNSHCSACKAFEDTIHQYVLEGKQLYYLYIDSVSNETADLIFNKLLSEVPSDRNMIIIEGEDMYFHTPLSIYVENGIFKDGYAGYVGYDTPSYDIYLGIMNGDYKDTSYPFE